MSTFRRVTRITSCLCILALLAFAVPDAATAQERGSMLPRVSPNAGISQSIGVTTIDVHYGRPAVRDRDVFGNLVPYGDVWRTGANEATAIAFSTPVTIQGTTVDAGTYSFFTVPGEDEWTIILNDTVEQWGAYNYDESKDVVRVTAEPESGPMHERLTFGFSNITDTSATLTLMWDETHVPLEISVDTRDIIAERGDTAVETAENWQVPLRYAGYALQNDLLTEKALTWADASLQMEETFPGLAVKARLQAMNGSYDAAIQTAERAVEIANAMDEAPRGLDGLTSDLEEWRSR